MPEREGAGEPGLSQAGEGVAEEPPGADPVPAGWSSSLAAGDIVAERYRIERRLGRGGAGEVFEATDRLLGERVALKTVLPDLAGDPLVLRRFQHEIQLARQVTHPNVCRVFEAGTLPPRDGGTPVLFFTMELLSGETLRVRIQRAGRFTWEAARPIILQLADGLDAAHRAGIVHRDFKSGNVLLVRQDSGERAVITDFGLARRQRVAAGGAESTLTAMGELPSGTLAYMSPEQLAGGPVTGASDLYSLGIVLFEMATGRLPFESAHLVRAALERVRGETPPVRRLAPDIDWRWETAIRRCLEAEPARRFASAAELADWVRQERPQIPRWAIGRRHWTVALSLAAAGLSAGLGGYWWVHRSYQPKVEALGWHERGVTALHAATYEAARRALEQAVAADPGFALAHAALARAFDELDYSERAKESILRALTVAEQSPLSADDTRRLRAAQSLVSRDYERAAHLLTELANDAPARTEPAAFLELGWLEEKREDPGAAAAAYERALKADPRYGPAHLRRAALYGRRGQTSAAIASFQAAADYYRAASDWEGVTEALLQHAVLLNRRGRSGEAIPLLEEALAAARTHQSRFQEIRLLLALGVAYRNTNASTAARETAAQAVRAALDANMEHTATSGLLDLGNAFFARGEPGAAEEYFRQALGFARRNHGRRNEARALLSLGSLAVQYDRPAEARPLVAAALPFYRQGGYRRELAQALLILTSIHEQQADLAGAARSGQEAHALAKEVGDAPLAAQTRDAVARVQVAQGLWPQALAAYETTSAEERARASSPRLAYALLNLADLTWRIGRRAGAERTFREVHTLLARLEGDQRQLRARALLREAEMELAWRRPARARTLAREGLALLPASPARERGLLEMVVGLSRVREGKGDEGRARCAAAIGEFERGGQALAAATARVTLSEILLDSGHAQEAADTVQPAMAFLESRQLWEPAWRAHRVLAEAVPGGAATHREAARAALANLEAQWPAAALATYLARPDLASKAPVRPSPPAGTSIPGTQQATPPTIRRQFMHYQTTTEQGGSIQL